LHAEGVYVLVAVEFVHGVFDEEMGTVSQQALLQPEYLVGAQISDKFLAQSYWFSIPRIAKLLIALKLDRSL
jgi:hypothetical protein